MFKEEILKRFKNPVNAGGMRGANGTGKAGDIELGEIVKIYLAINENEIIEEARFKAYGGVLTIAGSDIVCDMLTNISLQDAINITKTDINEKIDFPAEKEFVASIIEESIKSAIEDYYKKKEKEDKKSK